MILLCLQPFVSDFWAHAYVNRHNANDVHRQAKDYYHESHEALLRQLLFGTGAFPYSV